GRVPMERPLRFCDVCGGLDDHPRHVIAVPPGTPEAIPSQEFLSGLGDAPASATALLLHPQSLMRHHDCCAAQGCEVCQATEAVHGGARGDALWASIESGAADNVNTDGLKVGGLGG